jgi:hypothetical protein
MSTSTVTADFTDRAQIEKALWELTGFSGDQTLVDGVMTLMDTYAIGLSDLLSETPTPVVEAYLHTLVQLAEQILDGGVAVRPDRPVTSASTAAQPAAFPGAPAPRPGTFFNPDGTITCRGCGQAKDPGEGFSNDKQARTGKKSICRTCDSAARQARKRK